MDEFTIDVTDYYNFGQYCYYYLDNKQLFINMMNKCEKLSDKNSIKI